MTWPYAFLTLTDAEKLHRRESLDWYAVAAQLSVACPLVIFQSYYLSSRFRAHHSNANTLTPPSSPRIKRARGTAGDWSVQWRRLKWWMGEKVVLGGDVVGSRGEVLGAVVWLLWLVSLSVVGTGRDYLHFTKRLGIIAASQLPLHYLLALKSPYSPLQYLTARSHESLNTLHQLLGRMVTFLVYGHAALYLNFYVQSNLLSSKVQEAYVIAGIVSVLAFTAVGTTALSPVRRWRYRVFYVVHIVLATLLLPVLWFHVSHIRIYLYETAVVYACNAFLRTRSSHTLLANLRLLNGGRLVEIRIPFASSDHNRSTLQPYQPGQHAYLSLPGHPASRTFRSNPFSLASCPTIDNELRFVARILDGNTAALATAVRTPDFTKHSVTIEGPYGLNSHADRLLQCDRVLFVAGGVGGTFVSPLYRQLLADLSPSAGSYRRQKVTFAWAAKSIEDVEWALPVEGREGGGFGERLQVWVTGAGQRDARRVRSSFEGEAYDSIELQESKGLLPVANGSGGDVRSEVAGLDVRRGRPDLRRLVDDVFSQDLNGRVGVVVCGPRSLNAALREEIGPWIQRGRDTWFWEESFAL